MRFSFLIFLRDFPVPFSYFYFPLLIPIECLPLSDAKSHPSQLRFSLAKSRLTHFRNPWGTNSRQNSPNVAPNPPNWARQSAPSRTLRPMPAHRRPCLGECLFVLVSRPAYKTTKRLDCSRPGDSPHAKHVRLHPNVPPKEVLWHLFRTCLASFRLLSCLGILTCCDGTLHHGYINQVARSTIGLLIIAFCFTTHHFSLVTS